MLNLDFCKDYLVISTDKFDEFLDVLIGVAHSYVMSRISLTEEEVEADPKIEEQLNICEMIIVEHLFQQRTYTIDKNLVENPILKSILSYYADEWIL